MKKITEGYTPYSGYKTYYKSIGSPSKAKAPILILHGGPGGAHNYLLGLAALAEMQDRQVIYYDQH